jgi:lipopolysaccharide biosynthesis glycosyltransferase
MFEHADDDTFYTVHVINYQLKIEGKQKIEQLLSKYHPQSSVIFLDLSDEQYERIPAHTGRYGKEVNYLFFLPALLPDLHKIICLDVDILILSDLGVLFNLNMHGQAILSCRVVHGHAEAMERAVKMADFLSAELRLNDKMICGNSGVLPMDLILWRKLNWMEDALNILNSVSQELIPYPDQDIINYLSLRDNQYKVSLPWAFNAHSFHAHKDDNSKLLTLLMKTYLFFQPDESVEPAWQKVGRVHILHYAAVAPWKTENYRCPEYDLYKTYADKIGWNLPIPIGRLSGIRGKLIPFKQWVKQSGKKLCLVLLLAFTLGLMVSLLIIHIINT